MKTARAGCGDSHHDMHIAIEAGLVHEAYVGVSKFVGVTRLLGDVSMAETSTGRNTEVELHHSLSTLHLR